MRKNDESDQSFKNRFLLKDHGNLIFCNQKRLATKMQTAARKEHVNFSSWDISLSPVMAGD